MLQTFRDLIPNVLIKGIQIMQRNPRRSAIFLISMISVDYQDRGSTHEDLVRSPVQVTFTTLWDRRSSGVE